MSTTVRSSSDSRSGRGGRGGRADDPGRADRTDQVGRVDRAGRGARAPQGTLTGRALRVRNTFVCHAAARLGLAAPTDAELRELPADARLAEAVEWWSARARGASSKVAEQGAGLSLVLKTAVVMGVTLVGLAFSYGQAQ